MRSGGSQLIGNMRSKKQFTLLGVQPPIGKLKENTKTTTNIATQESLSKNQIVENGDSH